MAKKKLTSYQKLKIEMSIAEKTGWKPKRRMSPLQKLRLEMAIDKKAKSLKKLRSLR